MVGVRRRPPLRARRGPAPPVAPSRIRAAQLLLLLYLGSVMVLELCCLSDRSQQMLAMLHVQAFHPTTSWCWAPPPRSSPLRIPDKQRPCFFASSGIAQRSISSAVHGRRRRRRRRGGGARMWMAAAPEVRERQDQDQDQQQQREESELARIVGDDVVLETDDTVVNVIRPAVIEGGEIGDVAAASDHATGLDVPALPTSDNNSSSADAGLGLWAARGLLLLVAAIWGTNFAVRAFVCFLVAVGCRFIFLRLGADRSLSCRPLPYVSRASSTSRDCASTRPATIPPRSLRSRGSEWRHS